MGYSNRELMKKADWAVSDLASNGGLLNPEQADTFIRKLLIQPTLLKQSRVVTMNAPQRKINKIGFASRILNPATSATALASGSRSKPTTEQIQLNTTEVIAEVHLPYDLIEDNIEQGGIQGGVVPGDTIGGGIKDTIMSLIAERAALDLEELALKGDTTSGDPYLALKDGFLKQISTNVVDAGNNTISKAIFKAGVKAMPPQYLRDRAVLNHFISVNNETEYRDTLASRETALGDSQFAGVAPVYALGSPVQAVGLMPGANGIFTNPQNFIFGIQRQINIEAAKDIQARVFIIVLTARIDFRIEQEDACVKYINING